MSSINNHELPLTGLPGWVKWLAQDEDGAWWGYSVEPLEFSHGWYENEVGMRKKIKQSDVNPDWKNSLTKVLSR
ncbi:MAG: hypothetical protein OQK75_05230 [Gammaproteobacteria bacterium]|nr:hypothetical protein [Gammaproteobacteria bacterium]MCW8987058.1 hypothetical protein [Gammaproteobacteria bacterium]